MAVKLKASTGPKTDLEDKLRASIEESMKRAEEQHKREMFVKRFEFAKAGLRDSEALRLAEAVRNFHSYLKILEDWKKVDKGGLTPAHFDKKIEAAEIVLICAVYWEMARLYDRTKTKKGLGELKTFLDKFVLFAKGSTFEPVCAETMRKYISRDKPKHKREFSDAYRKLAGKECFVAHSLADELEERTIPRLRWFRDEKLLDSRLGSLFVSFYYGVGPAMAGWMSRRPRWFRRVSAAGLDGLSRVIVKAFRSVQDEK